MRYDQKYYQNPTNERMVPNSAVQVLKILFEVYKPKSIIDVGCGNGVWLNVANSLGVNEFLGIDGKWSGEWNKLPKENYFPCNLEEFKFEKINKKYDLALCLEVIEHIDNDSSILMIKEITKLSPVILFSAALPFQGGDHHINENWLDYWKNYFEKSNYYCFDFIRPQIWNNDDIYWWYRQNIVLFVNKNSHEYTEISTKLDLLNIQSFEGLNIVHPQNYFEKLSEVSLRQSLTILLRSIKRFFRRRLRRLK